MFLSLVPASDTTLLKYKYQVLRATPNHILVQQFCIYALMKLYFDSLLERVESIFMEYNSTKYLVSKSYFSVKIFERQNNRQNLGDVQKHE